MPTMGIPLTQRPVSNTYPVLGLGILDARLHSGTILLHQAYYTQSYTLTGGRWRLPVAAGGRSQIQYGRLRTRADPTERCCKAWVGGSYPSPGSRIQIRNRPGRKGSERV